MHRFASLRLLAVAAVLPVCGFAQTPIGGVLFEQHCMSCHRQPDPNTHAPNREAMSQFMPERVLAALTTGAMAPIAQAAGLTDAQKRSIAEFISMRPLGSAGAGRAESMKNRCPKGGVAGDPLAGPSWNGWSPHANNARFQAQEAAGLTGADVPRLKLKWAFGAPGATSMYGLPVVVGGRVLFGTDAGYVYSLDAATGCVHWSFEAPTGVRTAVVVAPIKGWRGVRHAAFFGDVRANVYAVDVETGKQLWTSRVDEHALARLTAGFVLQDDRLIVPVSSWEETAGAGVSYECCTFRGSIVMLDRDTGRQIWKTYTIADAPQPTRKNSVGTQLYSPAGAAVWSTPTVDSKRRVIFVATGNAYTAPAASTSDAVLALDLDTGALRWVRQIVANDAWLVGCSPGDKKRTENCPPIEQQNVSYNDVDLGASPILTQTPSGQSVLIVAGESGDVLALDPDREGATIWQTHLGEAPKDQWQPGIGLGAGSDAQSVYLPLERYNGGLTAVSLATGRRVWHMQGQKANCGEGVAGCYSMQQGAITVIPGAVFSGAADGMLRAYSTVNGRVIWEFNTAQSFETVNGVAAKGGSVRGPGVTVVGGRLFAGSGYGTIAGIPGNVLLAFEVER